MELFGDSGSEDSDSDCGATDSESLSNLAFIHLLISKPFLKSSSAAAVTILYREVAFVGTEISSSTLKEKLMKTRFKSITDIGSKDARPHKNQRFDAVVNFSSSAQLCHYDLVIPGGIYITLCKKADVQNIFPKDSWNLANATRLPYSSGSVTDDSAEFIVVQKRAHKINTLGAIYWTQKEGGEGCRIGGSRGRTSRERNRANQHCNGKNGNIIPDSEETLIDIEHRNLDKITVSLSVSERALGVLSDSSYAKAVSALEGSGICIIPGLFSSSDVMDWGNAAISDMDAALSALKVRGIDLLNPGDGEPRIDNYHELSMREAFRCDLRNGCNVRALAARSVGARETDSSFSPLLEDLNSSVEVLVSSNSCLPSDANTNNISDNKENTRSTIRHHPMILSILRKVFNPLPADARDQLGNWGLWNFEGRGPEGGPPDFTVGQVGAVMSLPGCADQTIHADTPHLYVHTQLPPHYVNLFLPAVSEGSASAAIEVGQTAFVLGSHQLRVSAHVMNEEGGQEELEKRLVRPHLVAGDCLLFDCRILHFGLANQHPQDYQQRPEDPQDTTNFADMRCSEGWRPLLYVNYHHKFFHDPKNWNDKEKLF